ncbi:TIR domain-containing protein [Cyanothece sp. BG0011]|uniref:TIR domain-containing protein n=1 Tax=Cyanothece sp. BG0011 TaxID=2082950 RepID=UPI000D1D836C|nr:TIR domain-containing protein [Cyanothece sp. BG0011]
MSSGFEFDVFLAHNSLDKPQVRKISAKLRERGLKPWLDEEQIPPGKAFQDEIQKAIPQIKSAVIIIGSQGLGNWQKLELKTLISQFVNRNTSVIPVLLVGVNQIPDNLRFLKEFHWVKFEQEDDSRAFYNLEWGITGVKPPSNTKTVTLSAEEWLNSGYNKDESGDYQGAIADYNQAIKLNPDYALAYNNRGLAKKRLGDKQGAISDYNQAAQLYLQQNKMDDYSDALNRAKKLENKGFFGGLFG